MKRVIHILAILFLPAILFSQEFTASVNRNPVGAGERFEVNFTINGDASDFKPPSFRGFKVLFGPSQSQSMSINGRNMRRTLTIGYTLLAQKEGNYVIGPASIKSGGKTLKTKPIQIKVTPKSEKVKAAEQQKKDEAQQAKELIKKNLFIRLHLNKSSVYRGEQVIATYKLYKHPELPIVDFNPPTKPVLNGFWLQEISTPSQGRWKAEVINGVRYQVAELQRYLLIPQQYGKMKIDPLEFECIVQLHVQGERRRRRGFFDDFFDDPFFSSGRKNFTYVAKSNTATLNVKPLPEGAPADFTGGVGTYEMKAWLDKTKTKTNDPVSLKVRITGKGNLKLVDALELNIPPDFESYEPKVADNLSLGTTGYSGNKTFEYLLLPRHAGNFDLEPVTFTYFDLGKKEYVTLSSEQFEIEVTKGEGGETAVISGVTKEEIQYLGKDIRYIKTEASFDKGGSGFFGSIWFYALNGLAPLFFGFIIFYRKKKTELNKNQALLRNRKAKKMARKRLSTARDFMKKQERDKFYEETTRALWGYLSDKLGIPPSDLTKDRAMEELMKINVPGEKAEKYLETIDSCEYARFAPSSEAGDMSSAYEKAASVITDMEGLIR